MQNIFKESYNILLTEIKEIIELHHVYALREVKVQNLQTDLTVSVLSTAKSQSVFYCCFHWLLKIIVKYTKSRIAKTL